MKTVIGVRLAERQTDRVFLSQLLAASQLVNSVVDFDKAFKRCRTTGPRDVASPHYLIGRPCKRDGTIRIVFGKIAGKKV